MVWRDKAACKDMGPALFFPEPDSERNRGRPGSESKAVDYEPARVICGGCPVAVECLEDAMNAEGRRFSVGRHGVRGGLTPMERYRLSVGRGRQHGTRSCYMAGCKRSECLAAHASYQREAKMRRQEAS